jgi:hypothetical protein
MKRSRFSEVQIIAILKEQAAGLPTAEVTPEPVVITPTYGHQTGLGLYA